MQEVRVYREIAYGGHALQKLDMYLPQGQGFYTIVHFHGGALTSGDKGEPHFAEMAHRFAQSGYGFVAANYRMYPHAKYPEYLEDGAAAVAQVRRVIKDYGGNGELIVSGQSAGAWMSAMLCFNPAFWPPRE